MAIQIASEVIRVINIEKRTHTNPSSPNFGKSFYRANMESEDGAFQAVVNIFPRSLNADAKDQLEDLIGQPKVVSLRGQFNERATEVVRRGQKQNGKVRSFNCTSIASVEDVEYVDTVIKATALTKEELKEREARRKQPIQLDGDAIAQQQVLAAQAGLEATNSVEAEAGF